MSFKYNVGDEVWTFAHDKNISVRITKSYYTLFSLECYDWISLDGSQSGNNYSPLDLFPTKDALLEALAQEGKL